jgi:hypothetical protein
VVAACTVAKNAAMPQNRNGIAKEILRLSKKRNRNIGINFVRMEVLAHEF